MKKALIAAIIASLPAAAFADSTADQIRMLQEQLKALQQKVNELEQTKAAPAASYAADDDNAPAKLTQGELDEIKQTQANTKLKVDSLQQAATEGPLAGLSISGYLDPVYMYNRNAGSSSFNFVNHAAQTYNYDNSSFGDVYLDIKKTFGVGPMAPSIEFSLMPNRGNGNSLLSDSNGNVGHNPINSAQINLPLNDSTTFVAGLIPSFGGYEYQQSNQMLTLTHNLLYDFSDPGSYVGAGANYSTGNWAWRFFVGNEQYRTKGASVTDGAGNTHNNKTPTFTARADYTWSSALDLGWSVNAGRQTLITNSSCPAGNSGFGLQCSSATPFSNYYFTEVDATYTLADVQYNAEVDYGVQRKAAWNGDDARWYGLSLLAHRKFSTELFGRMGVTARYDYLNNSRNGGGGGGIALNSTGYDGNNGFGIDQACYQLDGIGLGCKGTNRQDIALDLLFYPTDQVTLKMEYRHDWASQAVFQKADQSYSKNNDIFGMQMIYAF